MLNSDDVNTMPSSTPAMTRQEAMRERHNKTPAINMASVDVSPTEPGIEPTKADIQSTP